MKITYEQLMLALDYGEVVIFQDTDGEFIAIGGAGKDKDGNYRHSGHCDTKEQCLGYIGVCLGHDQSELKELIETHEYIDSFAHAITDPVPKGTPVFIKDNAKEECERFNMGWNGYMDDMVGKCVEIEGVWGSDYHLYDEAKDDWWNFPRTAFTLILPTKERTLQDVFADLSEEDKRIIERDMKR